MILFSAGALGICLNNKRVILSWKEAQAREKKPGERTWIPAQAASLLSCLEKQPCILQLPSLCAESALHGKAVFPSGEVNNNTRYSARPVQ